MCQIIALKIKDVNVEEFVKNNKNDLRSDLHEKGGEGYSFFYQPLNKAPIITKGYNFKKVYYKFLAQLKKLSIDGSYGTLVLFSRQVPEMENSRVNLPPYYNEEMGMYFFVHGTIYNDKELAKEYNADISVDSEILSYIPDTTNNVIESVLKPLKGLFTIIGVGYGNKIVAVNNGMGLWRSQLHNDLTHSAVYKMTPTNRPYFKYGTYIKPYKTDLTTTDQLVISYSGGVDVTLSAYYTIDKWLNSNEFNPEVQSLITLVYFRYNTLAEEKELDALNKFKRYIIKLLGIRDITNVSVRTKVLNYAPIYRGFNGHSKLTQVDSTGDANESESNIAYVPFRNLIFATRLAHFIQDNPYTNLKYKKKIVFGLNLSEGQVFGDNNQAWLDNVNNTLQLSGKYFDRTIEVVSPFVNKTKTNMFKQFISEFGLKRFNELLDISFSCYYPKEDGTSCGECGSCILREKAVNIAIKN